MGYTNKERCLGRVYDPVGLGRFYRCSKKAVDGKPYCKIHDPEYVKAKGAAKQAQWEKEWAEEKAHQNLVSTALNACRQINPDNPQAVAESITAMYEALEGLLRDYSTNPTSDIYYEACLKAVNTLAKAEGK